MKIDFAGVVFICYVLVAFVLGQEREYKGGNGVRNGLTDMLSIVKGQILPAVKEQKTKLHNIIDTHKEPIQQSMLSLKDKLNEHMMNAGLDILEKSLNVADMLQNMTTKIKSEVLDIIPRKASSYK